MPNTYDLHGKNAIVTGGAKGIGRAIAELLITNACHVLIWDASPSDVSGATFTQLDIASSFNTGAVFDMSGGRARY